MELIDYDTARNCENPKTYYFCIRCGRCGRVFDDEGYLINDEWGKIN